MFAAIFCPLAWFLTPWLVNKFLLFFSSGLNDGLPTLYVRFVAVFVVLSIAFGSIADEDKP